MIDRGTLEHAIRLLEDRLQAVTTYGAGGCPTCHDAELRGAVVSLRRLLDPPGARVATTAPATVATVSGRASPRRR